MSHLGKAGLSLCVAALVGVTVCAQPPGGRRGPGGMGGGFGPAGLLRNEGVQKELNLSADQIQKVKDVTREVREKHADEFAKLQKIDDRQERREKMQPLMKAVSQETMEALEKVLNPDQVKRLKQLELQQRGPQAFTDPEVQSQLKLTDDQKEQLKTLAADAQRETREVFQGAQGNFQEAMKKVRTLRKETLDKALAVLTPEQKKTWTEMTGAPYEFKFEPRPGGRRPGRARPGAAG